MIAIDAALAVLEGAKPLTNKGMTKADLTKIWKQIPTAYKQYARDVTSAMKRKNLSLQEAIRSSDPTMLMSPETRQAESQFLQEIERIKNDSVQKIDQRQLADESNVKTAMQGSQSNWNKLVDEERRSLENLEANSWKNNPIGNTLQYVFDSVTTGIGKPLGGWYSGYKKGKKRREIKWHNDPQRLKRMAEVETANQKLLQDVNNKSDDERNKIVDETRSNYQKLVEAQNKYGR